MIKKESISLTSLIATSSLVTMLVPAIQNKNKKHQHDQ